jgi:hypothetical protein
MAHTAAHETSAEMQQCIRECLNCHETCVQTARHCLDLGGTHASPAHIATLLSCAEICQTSANVMLVGSELHTHTCAACAAICRACEQACRRMGDDDVMRECADACRRCAESCERMARAA